MVPAVRAALSDLPTEPLLRLNVEAATTGDMIRIRDEVLAIVRS